ncbi:MAG TPA: DUF3842 family protein [Nitrospiraceae bacterium]|jgi:hypothetical protein|nr:DUF3842 family protein [Nitrospiraceae bacterium]
MQICVVDGRGGGLGSSLIAGLRGLSSDGHQVIGLGLNKASADAMLRAGATRVETTPAALYELLARADVIAGSLSLVFPGSMLGEVSPQLAQAVIDSPAQKMLLPLNRRKVEIVGTEGRTLCSLIDHAVDRIASLVG